MAVKRKKTDDESIEAIDLITLLTPPSAAGCYEVEIQRPLPGEEFDLLKAAADLPDVPEPTQLRSLPATTKTRKPSATLHQLPTSEQPSSRQSEQEIENLLTGMRKPRKPTRLQPYQTLPTTRSSTSLPRSHSARNAISAKPQQNSSWRRSR
jgi:hypothetical protein